MIALYTPSDNIYRLVENLICQKTITELSREDLSKLEHTIFSSYCSKKYLKACEPYYCSFRDSNTCEYIKIINEIKNKFSIDLASLIIIPANNALNKMVIVINGKGGVGKDFLIDVASTVFRVKNYSSITPIKEIAQLLGWDGQKNNDSRKFLSDLKYISSEYNDFPLTCSYNEYKKFLKDENQILFLHIREKNEIIKFLKKNMEIPCKTLLIKRSGTSECNIEYGNYSDDDAENFDYDYVFDNNKEKEQIGSEFIYFLQSIYNNPTL